jgi:large subunit ribosomal protein L18
MASTKQKVQRRDRRKAGIRKRLIGTPQRPRLTVYRSLKHIYAQIINDLDGKTVVAASSAQLDAAVAGNKTGAQAVGKALAEKATAAGVKQVCFDRNGLRFHGRVKALADAAREGGLSF